MSSTIHFATRLVHSLALAATLLCLVAIGRAEIASESVLLQTAMDPQAGTVARTNAFSDLRAVATERSIPELVTLLHDRKWSYLARSVLEVMPGAAAEHALLDALATTADAALRIGCVHSLGNRRSTAAVPVMERHLGSSDAALVAATVTALGNVGNLPAGELLVKFEPPGAMQTVWGDALLRVAERQLKSERSRALHFLRRVVERGTAVQAASATLILGRAAENPVQAIAEMLAFDDRASREVALAVVKTGALGPELTRAVEPWFEKLSAETRIQLLEVLRECGDRAAASLARTAVVSDDVAQSTAAMALLGVVGEPGDAEVLILFLEDVERRKAATKAVARLAGDEVTTQLLAAFRSRDGPRSAALEALVLRGYRALVPELLTPERFAENDDARVHADALGKLATANDLSAVLRFYGELPVDLRGALGDAIRKISAKHVSAADAAREIVDAAKKLPPAETETLLVIVAGLGGETAFAALDEMLSSPSGEARRVAVRALGSWRDLRAGEALLRVAQEETEQETRSAAVKSATAVFSRGIFDANGQPVPARIPEAVAGLRKVWAAASTAAEKDGVIVALRGMKDERAIAAARELEQAAP